MPRPTSGPGVTRFATRGGQRLSYESIGPADGVPILALHDLLADRGQLRPLAATLPPDRYRLTLPDARGHGASPTISGRAYATSDLAADALAVLDAEGLARVHIAAIGWAAGTALGVAFLAPERVASLVLAEPFLPALIDHENTLETLGLAADAAEKGQTDRALDLYLGLRLEAGWRERLPKSQLGAMRRAAASLAPLLAGATETAIGYVTLERIGVPATILVASNAGARDRHVADVLAAVVPRSRLVTSTVNGELGSVLAQALAGL
jgi:pimeloyl-ACP methyl ester carboxylesterase